MKVINILLGIATLIILSALINLGIRAFHPEPERPEYSRIGKSFPRRVFNCEKGDVECTLTENEFYEDQQENQEDYDAVRKVYEDKMEIYNRDVFIIANIVGVFIFIAGFLLLFKTAITSYGVSVGVMMAGLYGIIYGYARGWKSTNDQLKFFIGLIIAVLVIGGSTWLLQKFSRKKKSLP